MPPVIKCHPFIDGRETKPRAAKYLSRENPATEKPFAEVALCGKTEVDSAVKSASRAFEKWKNTPAAERAKTLRKIAGVLEKNSDALALANTRETGKPIRESKLVEIGGSVKTLEYFAGLAVKIGGETIDVSANQTSFTIKEPVGVAAQIVPWNFPVLLAFWKISAALAAGCAVVVKPSELTSVAITEIAKLCVRKAGLPAGVLNIVTGAGARAGDALSRHSGVAKIAFTGSTQTGKTVMKNAADDVKPVSLELGGKASCVVFDDADIGAAVEACLRGGFFNQGQNCTAVTKLLLHEKIYGKFMSAYLKKIAKIKIGNPEKPDTEMGALISREHFEKVKDCVDQAVQQGARIACGGGKRRGKGWFFEPTVLEKVSPKNIAAKMEIFGPVVAAMKFKTEAEALKIANDTEYGLAGGVWTSDTNRANRCAREIKVGYLWINTYGGIVPQTPYGGLKQSGFGKELGAEGLENYLETKTVNIWTGGAAPKWYKG
ncbi:MAG: aldehyde dehydrogenase family protein [Candidatus Mycalebacterium zealandia]|nr:MAG: aldehyde dehydrogenase family protein [Candidatus Mycalebacterium zealandia]